MRKTTAKPDYSYVLIYLFTWFTGLIFYFISGHDDRKRKNAVQAIILGVISVVISFIPHLSEVAFFIWIYGLYVGYRAAINRDVLIPYISESINYAPYVQDKPENRIKKYLDRNEKILYFYTYYGRKEFGNGMLLYRMFLKVIFVATNKRILKIRYGFGIPETVDEIGYSQISSIYLDTLYDQSYYQITFKASKIVVKPQAPNAIVEDSEGNKYAVNVSAYPWQEETQFFEVKPIKWRLLDVTNPEVKEFVRIVKSQIKKT